MQATYARIPHLYNALVSIAYKAKHNNDRKTFNHCDVIVLPGNNLHPYVVTLSAYITNF